MSTSPPEGLWALLPASLRTAVLIALTTSLIAAGLMLKTSGSVEAPSEIAGGEDLAPNRGGAPGGASPSPTANASIDSRSRAILSVPGEEPVDEDVPDAQRAGFPTLGRYIYEVDGYEEATAFGRRDLPGEMVMTVDRNVPTDAPNVPPLSTNEVFLDLYFSEDHTERAVAAYTDDGVTFPYESSAVTFGPVDQQTEATYKPPVLQIAGELAEDVTVDGKSTATADDGTKRHTEDWTVTVEGTEQLEIFGRDTKTWVVHVERRSRPASAERFERERRYWYDPSRAIWVKWQETVSSAQDVGPGDFIYAAEYTATLVRAQPI